MPKKELIIGAVVIAVVAWVFIDATTTMVSTEQDLPPSIASGTVAVIIGWVTTLYAVGFVALGVWAATKTSGAWENLSQRFTLKATIPGHFFLALMPVSAGLLLILLTRQTTWGLYLAWLSLPAVLVVLAFTLRNRNGR
jgi:hypothetical protein